MSAIQVIFGRMNAQPIPPGNLRFDDLDGLIARMVYNVSEEDSPSENRKVDGT